MTGDLLFERFEMEYKKLTKYMRNWIFRGSETVLSD